MSGADQLSKALSEKYRLDRELGAGGMATVYLAEDLKHGRLVAIKVLHPDLGAALGSERFLAEIRTTAKLQHPHILPLLDSGDAGNGLLYYVMPFVRGETLRARLERERQLPIADAVQIAREVADALQHAHGQGIVHRDIKPENILLQDGHALVADFGIALAVQQAGGARMTQTGLSLGTPQYMSPEQAMGERTIDARSDVYALGAVTYEMLAGEPPFSGASVQAIVAKVLSERPVSLRTLRDTIPPHVEHAVVTALAKLPADRCASAGDFAQSLRESSSFSLAPALRGGTPGSFWADRRVLSSGAICLAVGLAAGFVVRRSASPPSVSVSGAREAPLTLVLGDAAHPWVGRYLGSPIVALSQDGTKLAWVSTDSTGAAIVQVRSLTDATIIATVQGLYGSVSFSPDGWHVAMQTRGRIDVLSLRGGGKPTPFPTTATTLARWASDSALLIPSDGELLRVSLDQRDTSRVAAPKQLGALEEPQVVPGTGRMLVSLFTASGTSTIAVVGLDGGPVQSLGVEGSRPGWVEAGFVTYLSDGAVWALPVDARTLKPSGEPMRVAGAVDGRRVVAYDVARNGVMAIIRPRASGEESLVMVDRADGSVREVVNERRSFSRPRFSPDGTRIAVSMDVRFDSRGSLWIADIAPRTLTRVSPDSTTRSGEWERDGRHLVAVLNAHTLVRLDATGSDGGTVLLQRPGFIWETAQDPSRRLIVWREDGVVAARDIFMASLDSVRDVRPVRSTPFDERGIALSFDGRWLAYTSDEDGKSQVYLCRLEPNGKRWLVSRDGGSEPRWSRDGELFYRSGDAVLALRVGTGTEPTFTPPTVVHRGTWDASPNEAHWDVSPDGRHFAFVRSGAGGPPPIELLLHWEGAVGAKR